MIRLATIEDAGDVFRMAYQFVQETAYKAIVDEHKLRSMIQSFIFSDPSEKVIFLHEGKAMLAATKSYMPFSSEPLATEVAWWVDEDIRDQGIGAQLIDAFTNWARAEGCTAVVMTCLDDSVASLYERHGFQLTERAYMRKI